MVVWVSYITVFFDGFLWVFSGASFPTFFRSLYFYGVRFKDFGDKTKILAKRFISTGFLVSGIRVCLWFSGVSL